MHWGSEVVSGRGTQGEALAGVNALTSPAFCPDSKQPELKHSAVKILKAELPWRLLAMAWFDDDRALRARERLVPLMARFDFAACVPFGRERTGVLFRAAAYEAPADALLEEIEAVLGLNASEALHYVDKKRGQRRSMRLAASDGQTRLDAFLLGGDTQAEHWIAPLLQEQQSAQGYVRLLLGAGAKPPRAAPARGRQVCSCFDVREEQISVALLSSTGDAAARLAQLQQRLQCGTNCGSCIPELQRMVRSQIAQASVALVGS